jgi:hypothetical protein
VQPYESLADLSSFWLRTDTQLQHGLTLDAPVTIRINSLKRQSPDFRPGRETLVPTPVTTWAIPRVLHSQSPAPLQSVKIVVSSFACGCRREVG